MATPSRDGGFSDPSFISVGDPYNRTKFKERGVGGNFKPFLTCPSKKGRLAATFGPGYSKFDPTRGEYAEQYKLEARCRLENTKKFTKPNGFRYSSPAQRHTGSGDFYGAFDKVVQDKDEGRTVKQAHAAPRPHPKARQFEKKNVCTKPGSRGTFGYAGTLIGGNVSAMDADYGSEQRAVLLSHARNKAAIGDRKPFQSSSKGGDVFDSHDHVAASRIMGRDGQCQATVLGAQEGRTSKHKAAARASTNAPWKPPHPIKRGHEGLFATCSERLPERSEAIIGKRAVLPTRCNRLTIANQSLSTSLRERKAFKPSSGPKTKLTRGTWLLGMSKHHL